MKNIIKYFVVFVICGLICISFIGTQRQELYVDQENANPVEILKPEQAISNNNCTSDGRLADGAKEGLLTFQISPKYKYIAIKSNNIISEHIESLYDFTCDDKPQTLVAISYLDLNDTIYFDISDKKATEVKILITNNNELNQIQFFDEINTYTKTVNHNTIDYIVPVLIAALVSLILTFIDIKFKLLNRLFQIIKKNKYMVIKALIVYLAALIIALILDIGFNLIIAKHKTLDGLFSLRQLIFIANALVLIWYFIKSFRNKRAQAHKAFIAVSLACGFAIIAICPIGYSGWDLDTHYKINSNMASLDHHYSKSDKLFFNSAAETISQRSDIINKNKADMFDANNDLTIGYTDEKYDLAQIPSATVLSACRFIGVPFTLTLDFMKVINLLLYVLFCALGIKRLKSGKIIACVICLFPTCLFQACSISYDYWVISLMFLGVAWFFSEMQQPQKSLKIKDSIIMFGCISLACIPKQVYLPILLLPFFLYKESFKQDYKQKWKHYSVGLVFILLILCSLLLRTIFLAQEGGDLRGGNVDMTSQLMYILSNPVNFILLLAKHMLGFLSIANTQDYISNFGHLQISTICNYLILVLAAAVLIDKNKFDKYTHTWKIRTISAVVFFGTAILIATSFYLVFTPVGESEILGCQSRYLLPLLFPLVAVLGSCKIQNNIPKHIYVNMFLVICTFFIYLSTFQLMFLRML